MAAGNQFVLYIDDSGTKEYADSPSDYSTTGNSRYFVFGGVLITTAESGNLAGQIKNLKRRVFGTDAVEIKSNWIRIPKEREKRYNQRFGVDDAAIERFVHSLYSIITAADLRLFAAVVDKIHVQEDYSSPWYAPAISYEVLMQRVALEVKHPDTVSVIIDDMTGATPKGNQYRKNLLAHHEQLRRSGSRLFPGGRFDFAPVLPGIRFVDSAVSNLVQVSDIISYNVYRQFVLFGEKWETGEVTPDGRLNLPTYSWFDSIGEKFCQGPGGRVQGYGMVKFPLRNRIPWCW